MQALIPKPSALALPTPRGSSFVEPSHSARALATFRCSATSWKHGLNIARLSTQDLNRCTSAVFLFWTDINQHEQLNDNSILFRCYSSITLAWLQAAVLQPYLGSCTSCRKERVNKRCCCKLDLQRCVYENSGMPLTVLGWVRLSRFGGSEQSSWQQRHCLLASPLLSKNK